MGFILGCNYWASNAGADMWRNFDIDTIEKDLKTLSSHGVEYLRVFPNWRDFQPVMPVFSAMGNLVEYHLENDHLPTNPYYLNQKVMDEFSQFLTLCEKYKIKLIVGLITGWMSGRLYIPSALYGKNAFKIYLFCHNLPPLRNSFPAVIGFIGRHIVVGNRRTCNTASRRYTIFVKRASTDYA